MKHPPGSTDGKPGDEVRARLACTCKDLGLLDPAFSLHIKVLSAGPGLRLMLWAEEATREQVKGWLEEQVAEGGMPELLTSRNAHVAEILEPPKAWKLPGRGFSLSHLHLREDASVSVLLYGGREAVRAYVGSLDLGNRGSSVLAVTPGDGSHPEREKTLTRRQLDAVRAAWAAGYYEVPRTIKLSELADQMEMSSAALSALLRRAEREILGSYLHAQAETDRREGGLSIWVAEEMLRGARRM
ncbi:MAG: helix-turn-helix domain-containing protein [Candidatus Thermoplasmatota archaeon]|nr:helix-turn-helix domain-containing protein [Candidatus Thermoplasmatota archaeon]